MRMEDRDSVKRSNLFGHLMSFLFESRAKSPSQWCRVYTVAVAITVVTLFLRISLGAVFESELLLVSFVFPIILSSYLGGLGPGVVSTLLSAVLADYFLISPIHSFEIAKRQDFVNLVLLVINGVLISIFTEVLHRLRNYSEKRTNNFIAANRQLNEEIAERKRIQEALIKSNRRHDLLAETASSLLMSDSPQDVVNSLCQKFLDFLDCDTFFNYLVDDEKKRLHLNACSGIPEEDVRKMEWLDYGVGLCGCSARDGCRLVVEDLQDTQDQYTSLVRQFGIQAYACHPLIVQGKVLGTLSFCTRKKTRFTEDELSLMKLVTDQVAIAVSRKRSEADLRLARDELEKRVEERTGQLAKTIDALRVSEKKYRTLFEESKDVVFIVDDQGKIVDINPAGEELLGYKKYELLALDLVRDLNINGQIWSQLRRKLVLAGYINDAELDLREKDGGTVTVIISASLMHDDAGRPTGYRGIAHDVTERKLLEQQLLQAQKLESVGLLAGGIAHEFNNLLTGISGYGQIIEDTIPPDDELLQESIGQLLRAADRAAELTKSLLAFSRKQLINPKPVHVHTIIHNTVGLIKRILGGNIELSTSFSDKKLLVKVDAGQMEQVLMNLATNARDAMPSGGRIQITTEEVVVKEGSESNYGVAVPGIYAHISVSDTGIGIDKKSLERVFEPFYTTKEIGKGTGLGLSIVYGIVKQNNGSVLIASEPGKGTTVSIYLQTIDEVPISTEKRHKIKPVYRGSETILVAEDDEMVKTFLAKILKRAGYTVITAEDGEDAVIKFKEKMDDISLVLTDVVMPKKNGKEILEEIKMIRPEMRVIFISGYSAEFIDKKVFDKVGTDFITKPFLKNDLLQKVREVLDAA